MILSILSLLALSMPASADAPYIEESNASCSWDDWYDNYYWSLNAHVYDNDADISWAEFRIIDREDRVLAQDYMWLTLEEGTYSFWYYNFYEFPGGPSCPTPTASSSTSTTTPGTATGPTTSSRVCDVLGGDP